MGVVIIGDLEIEFDEDFSDEDSDDQIIQQATEDWFEENESDMFFNIERYDGGYTFSLYYKSQYLNQESVTDHQTFYMEKLLKDAFSDWVDDNKDSATVQRLSSTKKRKV